MRQTEVVHDIKNIDGDSEHVIEENLNVITPVINDGSAIPVKEKSKESINGETRLPKLLLCNIQSFSNSNVKADKTSETEEVLNMNNIDICVFTETWLSEMTKDQLKFSEYIMFHAVRKNFLRASGGVSIFVERNIPASEVKIRVPDHLECLWITTRPKWLPRTISNIVVCGVYYPGSDSDYAPDQEDLIFHITTTIHQLCRKYSRPLFMIMGDFNDLRVDEICDACKLKQIVKVPTRNQAILDLILTNEDNSFYKDPTTLPSIGGSDHLCVLYEPVERLRKSKVRKKKILRREFKKSALLEFGMWLTRFQWSELVKINDVNLKILYFFNIMWAMIDKFFPLKSVTSAWDDKEWMTPKIKCLIRERQKAFKSKNFDLSNHLSKKIKQEIKIAKREYNKSKANQFSSSNAKEWYRHISRIINNGTRKEIILNNIPEIVDKSCDEIIEIINNHFGKICLSYPPMDSNRVISEIPNEQKITPISEIETYNLLRKFSKKSLGHGDFPRKILQEFCVELAFPFSDITNCSLKSGIFPEAYKISEIIPIPKENPPRALKDLRPISKTPVGGKIIEKRIMYELEMDTKETLNDPTQYGNAKGSSTTHYLIKMTDEAYSSTDVGKATTAITIDYSKAFDLVDHNILIDKLVKLGVRAKIIKLIISFLSDRSHYTKIGDKISNIIKITCGVPQGTISGPRLFTILINGVKCNLVSSYKFVDDKTLAYSYSGDPSEFLKNVLDIEIVKTLQDKMKINESKCNIINFNFSQNNKITQGLSLNGDLIRICDKITLLGVIISEDLRWSDNTKNICKKVNKKFFLLSKLKQFGLTKEELLTAWNVMLRPITEYAAPLWHSGITAAESNKLENLQKRAIGFILGTKYKDHKRFYKVNGEEKNYEEALDYLNLTTLKERRERLTCRFAIDTAKNVKHKGFFELKTPIKYNTRSTVNFKENFCLTERYKQSAIPYMSRILNKVQFPNRLKD